MAASANPAPPGARLAPKRSSAASSNTTRAASGAADPQAPTTAAPRGPVYGTSTNPSAERVAGVPSASVAPTVTVAPFRPAASGPIGVRTIPRSSIRYASARASERSPSRTRRSGASVSYRNARTAVTCPPASSTGAALMKCRSLGSAEVRTPVATIGPATEAVPPRARWIAATRRPSVGSLRSRVPEEARSAPCGEKRATARMPSVPAAAFANPAREAGIVLPAAATAGSSAHARTRASSSSSQSWMPCCARPSAPLSRSCRTRSPCVEKVTSSAAPLRSATTIAAVSAQFGIRRGGAPTGVRGDRARGAMTRSIGPPAELLSAVAVSPPRPPESPQGARRVRTVSGGIRRAPPPGIGA